MHAIWTLADSGGGLLPFIVILVLIAIQVIKVVTRNSRQQGERRGTAEQPRNEPERVTAAPAPERGAAASPPEKGAAAREVDRFFEQLARQSGAPVPPRQPALPPRRPATVATPAPHVPAAAAKSHAPAPVHHAPSARPQPGGAAAMAEAMALPAEQEPVAGVPAMTHLSPLAQAIVLREILGPCRAFKPHRNRARGW